MQYPNGTICVGDKVIISQSAYSFCGWKGTVLDVSPCSIVVHFDFMTDPLERVTFPWWVVAEEQE